jgi:hypothetical protein
MNARGDLHRSGDLGHPARRPSRQRRAELQGLRRRQLRGPDPQGRHLHDHGEKVKTAVIDGTFELTNRNGYVSLSGSGYASWSNAGRTHAATLEYA